MERRALQLTRQIATANPTCREPMAMALELATRLNDTDEIRWACVAILKQSWPIKERAMETKAIRLASATLYELDGRVDEAVAQYEKAIELDTTMGEARNNLAYLLAEKEDGTKWFVPGLSILYYAGDGLFCYSHDMLNMTHIGQTMKAMEWKPPAEFNLPPRNPNRDVSLPAAWAHLNQ